MSTTNLYVGAMNDGVFIIDKPPRPVPTDHVGNHPDVRVVAKMAGSDAAAIDLARLIAAAPALLEACKAVNKCGNGGAKLSRAASDKVRAAIREAEGPDEVGEPVRGEAEPAP